MFKLKSGTTHNLNDTETFIQLLDALPEGLRGLFDDKQELVVTRAPGRLDLMGGIADYSGSLVLQLPIAAATHAALQRHQNRLLRIVSLSANQLVRSFDMPLDDFFAGGELIDYRDATAKFRTNPDDHWAAYVAGAFWGLMRERGVVFDQGASVLLYSDVPEAKGVSSSAALEVATMQAITAAFEVDLAPREMAFLCQKVENLIAGAPCGVMDQMTSACGEADRLLALLCQPGEIKEMVQLPRELAVWGIDSGIRHSVGGADYGTVRTAAFMGYRMIAEKVGLNVHETGAGKLVVNDPKWNGYLANITPDEFDREFASYLPIEISGEEFLSQFQGITDSVTAVLPERSYPVYQATRHPIFEHARVRKFSEILNDWRELGHARELGGLMYQSHESYSACGLGSEGTDEIVRLVQRAGEPSGLFGAKITGGGSGGTVAVLGRRDAEESVRQLAVEYKNSTGHQPLIISGSSPGAGIFGHLKLYR